jgi:hypothetical protein
MIKLINILHEIKIFSSFFQIAKDEDEESQFYEETDYVGSGLTGYILGKMSYNELARKLGAEATLENDESYSDGGSKVSAEWIIKTGNPPQIVRIYDYKGDVATPEERDEKIVWHVGGDKETSRWCEFGLRDYVGRPAVSWYQERPIIKGLPGIRLRHP